jgi:uncharacterized protein YggT (Ycf19 family)
MTDPLQPDEAVSDTPAEPVAPADTASADAPVADPGLAALVAADVPEGAEAPVAANAPVPLPPVQPPPAAPMPLPVAPPPAPAVAPPVVTAAAAPVVAPQPATAAPRRRGALYALRRVVAFLFGILQALLIVRIVLLLLNANLDNDIVDWIISATQPFVDPFLGMFNLDSVTGQNGSVLDIAAIVALIAWTLIETLIVSVLRLFDRRSR